MQQFDLVINLYLDSFEMGEPQAASGESEILSYDAKTNMAAISVKFDGNADNQILLQY